MIWIISTLIKLAKFYSPLPGEGSRAAGRSRDSWVTPILQLKAVSPVSPASQHFSSGGTLEQHCVKKEKEMFCVSIVGIVV